MNRYPLDHRWFRLRVLLTNRDVIMVRVYEPSIVAAIVNAQAVPNVAYAEFVAFGHGVTEAGKGFAIEHAND